MDKQQHTALTIDQFTQQAVPFAKLPGHSTSLDMLVRMAAPQPQSVMLDVACGPGLVACHFAPLVRHVTGLDLTPEMLRQASLLQREKGIENASWLEGTASPLPFADDAFSLVLTRYSFHHFLDPLAAMQEMIRVCQPGGRVVVADVCLPADKVARYDELELLRDPSHVHALSREEFATIFADSRLVDVSFCEYKIELVLEEQLAASFPVPGGAERIRKIVADDVGIDQYGIGAYYDGETLRDSLPVVVGAATRRK